MELVALVVSRTYSTAPWTSKLVLPGELEQFPSNFRKIREFPGLANGWQLFYRAPPHLVGTRERPRTKVGAPHLCRPRAQFPSRLATVTIILSTINLTHYILYLKASLLLGESEGR